MIVPTYTRRGLYGDLRGLSLGDFKHLSICAIVNLPYE